MSSPFIPRSSIHSGPRIKRVPAKREPVVKVRKRIRKVGKKAIRWAQFRKQILKRDGNKCVLCKQDAYQVHHRKKRSVAPHMVFDPENCISLCDYHHVREHEQDNPKWSK